MLGNFRSSLPHNHFLLLIYGVILKWPLFMHPVAPVATPRDAYLYVKLVSYLSHLPVNPPLLFAAITFFLMYLQAVLLNGIVNDQKLFSRPNHLTAMFFLLFTSLFPDWFVFSPALLINGLLIVILSKLCGLQGHNNTNKTFFNIGILLGLAVLCCFSSVVFLLLVLLGLVITRAFRINEWIIVILGIITPAYFLWAALYLSGANASLLYPVLQPGMPVIRFSMYEWISLSLILLITLIGFGFSRNHMLKLLVQSRKSWGLFYLFLIFSSVMPFLNASSGLTYLLPLVVVLSVLGASAYHYPEKKWFSLFSHWALFILATLTGYFFIH